MPRQTDGISYTPQWNFLGTGDTTTLQAFNSLNDTYSLIITEPLGDLRYQPLNTKLTAIAALANASGVLTNNGSGVFSYAAAATGTVTSVAALTLGTTGTDLSSSVANGTTTPVITLNVPTASASNRGVLSSTDWSAFNAKQSAITFGTGVQTALGVNIGSAGAPVLFNGAGGTPSSLVGTNITGTASGLTAGLVTDGVYTSTFNTLGDARYTLRAGDTFTGATNVNYANPRFGITATTGTNPAYITIQNTGGAYYIGAENSAGSEFGATAYALVNYTSGTRPIEFFTNGTKRLSINGSTGVAAFNNAIEGTAIKLTTGASNGYVLKSDASGNASWQPTTSSYQGTWDANTNTPTVADGVGANGDYYSVSIGGTQFGRTFTAGGLAIYNGSIWEPIAVAASVTSVNGLTGTPVINPTLSGNDIGTTGGSATIDISTATGVANKMPLAGGTFTGAVNITYANPRLNITASTPTNPTYTTYANTETAFSGLDNSTGSEFGGSAYSLNHYVVGNRDINFFTNATRRMVLSGAGALRLNAYGAGVLSTDGSGNVTTGAIAQSDVTDLVGDLAGKVGTTGNETIAGEKTFTDDIIANGTGGITTEVTRFTASGFLNQLVSPALANNVVTVLPPLGGDLATTSDLQAQASSGTYTPTVTNSTNVTANTPASCNYFRVGNAVTVSGYVNLTTNLATAYSAANISLPISSNLGASTDLSGVGQVEAGDSDAKSITLIANTSGDTALLSIISGAASDTPIIHFTFTYRVI
jgi:hypothetical protein